VTSHDGHVSQPAPEYHDWGWRVLREVLEERDAEYWAEEHDDTEE
jgi:hypothetical protein